MNYLQRQKKLSQSMIPRSACLFMNPPPAHKSGDEDYPYRSDNHMKYICGLEESLAVFIVLSHDLDSKTIALVKERDPEKERWLGPTLGLEGAKQTLKCDEVYALSSLDDVLDKILFSLDALYYDFTRHSLISDRVQASISRLRKRGRRASEGPRTLIDLNALVSEMRKIKDDDEIKIMAQASQITVEGFKDALAMIKPEIGEWAVEAELFRGFRSRGASGTSFDTIVASGNNATTLHYASNQMRMRDGDLVLIDAGALYQGYAGDISRTFPVNGKFSPPQREIYNIVLKALYAGIEAARLGNTMTCPHNAVRRVICEGLHDLAILDQSAEEIFEKKLDFAYFMHGTSHYIGLDTHDCGTAYQRGDDKPAILEEGVVISIEPGLYFPEDCESVPPQYRGIGVRIEDDILITKEGPRNLTQDLVKEIDDIEAFMRESNA